MEVILLIPIRKRFVHDYTIGDSIKEMECLAYMKDTAVTVSTSDQLEISHYNQIETKS